jgi:hypothetical protein
MAYEKMSLSIGNDYIRIFFQCNQICDLLVEIGRGEDIVDNIGKFLFGEHNNYIDLVVIKVHRVRFLRQDGMQEYRLLKNLCKQKSGGFYGRMPVTICQSCTDRRFSLVLSGNETDARNCLWYGGCKTTGLSFGLADR